MKLDRLLAIVMLLVNKKRVQAKEFAETFDVSIRTIYRDIETINQAGIPIITYQGINGGLGIAENFKVDRNVLTPDDMISIVSALKSISTTYDDRKMSLALEKIKGLVPGYKADEFKRKTEQVIFDLSPWGGANLHKERIKVLREAIELSKIVSFEYTNIKGESLRRKTEPMALVLKLHTWYLYGYCREKKDYRLFKLSRMKNLIVEKESFARREKNLDELPWDREWHHNSKTVDLVIKFSPTVRAIMEDYFGEENIHEDIDGCLTAKITCPEDEWIYGMILSYGENVEVLSPDGVRAEIARRVERINRMYNRSV